MKTAVRSFGKRLLAMLLVVITLTGICFSAVPVSAASSSVSKSASSKAVDTSSNYYTVTTKTAKLRKSTKLLAGTYVTLDKNAVVKISGSSGDYYKVAINGTTYYIKKAEVKKASATTNAKLYCTTKSAPLRKGPYEEAGKVATLAKGEVVTVLGTLKNSYKNTWLIVSYQGQLLYLYSGNASSASKVTLALSGADTSLSVGKTLKLKATTSPASLKVTWQSSNSNIATVDSNGQVKGVNPGNVVITAKVGNIVAASYNISVNIKLSAKAVRQTTNYTCSAAASLVVLRHYNKAQSTTDTQLYPSINGYVYAIVNALNKQLGSGTYRYEIIKNVRAYEKAIITSLKQGAPVIARVAFKKQYFNYDSNGHYTTIVGIDYDSNGRAWLSLVDSFVHNYKNNGYTNAQAGTVRIPLDELFKCGKSTVYLIYNP